MRTWIARHPAAAFFAGAYAISWTLWLPSVFVEDRTGPVALLFFLGVFGPFAAAAIVGRVTSGSARAWLRGILRFRVAKRWYLFALGVPVAIVVTGLAAMAVAGVDLEFSLLDERLAAFIPTLLFCVFLNGGPEEPGWRGLALPELEKTRSPIRATLELGTIWALWHTPLLFMAEENIDHGLDPLPFAGIVVWTIIGIACGYSFFYTYLWNRTQSVVPCILLHASFNTANGVLLLVPESQQVGGTYAAISICVTGIIVAAAAVLVYATRGRLGYGESRAKTDSNPWVDSPAENARLTSGATAA
jgi:uncharacterized protein